MDRFSDPEFYEYLSEYRLQSNNEPISHYEEGELEAQWLISAGYPELTKPFEQGLELQTSLLTPIIANLSRPHAEAVKQRVRALNRTVRGRTKSRYKRKPDIRDVFRDFDESSTGTRSRSATPDSLDSIHGDHDAWNNPTIPNFVSIFDTSIPATTSNLSPLSSSTLGKQKQKLRRTPSAPLRGSAELFRGSHVRCDIPFYSADGIELLGFSRIGTMHIPRIRSGSDPSCSIGRAHGNLIKNARSDNNISIDPNSSNEYLSSSPSAKHSPSVDEKTSISPSSPPQKIHNTRDSSSQSSESSPSREEVISFESMCRETSQRSMDIPDGHFITESSFDIDTINESDIKKLQTLFWLELATLFDKNHVTLDKRKPFKRRRKEEGNLFGVSLNALIRRDQQITEEDSTLVPLFLQDLLRELTERGATEKGILRIAGHKQKTELLYNELELVFYQKPEKVQQLLSSASCHDLCALLKRWLRELPQPLLTCEFIQLFYQIHAIQSNSDQYRALSIVCMLLPHENRNTLRSILKFLNYVIQHESSNKMTMHNVATIIAPSFFPPRYIHPVDKNNIGEQVKMLAECCQLTNVLITKSESLFMVPKRLIEQTSKCTKNRQGKRVAANGRRIKQNENHLSDVCEINPSHVHRIVI